MKTKSNHLKYLRVFLIMFVTLVILFVLAYASFYFFVMCEIQSDHHEPKLHCFDNGQCGYAQTDFTSGDLPWACRVYGITE